MFKLKQFIYLTFALVLLMPIAQAEEQNRAPAHKSYVAKVGNKTLQGFANITTGVLEVPKNIINVTNAPGGNVFYGLVGGSAKGLIDMFGRTGAGIADLITAPLPTKPITQPNYVWQDFDVNTTYGSVFRLDND